MKVTTYLSILILACTTGLQAQNYWSKHYVFQIGNAKGLQVQMKADTIIVFVDGLCNGANLKSCFGIIKCDMDGNLLYKKVNIHSDYLFDTNSLRPMEQKGDTFLLHVNKYASFVDSLHFALALFDNNFNYLSSKKYGATGNSTYDWARYITDNSDGFYMSYEYKDLDLNKHHGKIRRVDNNLDEKWEYELNLPSNRWVGGSYAAAAPDGGVYVVYNSYKPAIANCDRSYIKRYTAEGEELWKSASPEHLTMYQSPFLKAYPGGGAVGIWTTDTFPFWYYPDPPYLADNMIPLVFKIDSNGVFEWQKWWPNYYRRLYYDIIPTKNGDIIVCGTADTTDNELHGGYISRISPQGERLWERKVIDMQHPIYDSFLYSGLELDNGDLLFTGGLDYVVDTTYSTHIWLLKTDSMGCVTPNCDNEQIILSAKDQAIQESEPLFMAYPNPVAGHVFIASTFGAKLPKGKYALQVFDSQGRQVYLLKDFNPQLLQTISTENWPPGTWFPMQITCNGKLVQALKVVKEP